MRNIAYTVIVVAVAVDVVELCNAFLVIADLLRATAVTDVAHLGHRNSVCPFIRLCYTGGSVKNGAS